MNVLYSIGCPKCNVLERKLQNKNIPFVICADVDLILNKGIKSVPVLEVDGKIMDFTQANKWINAQGD